MPVHSFIHSFIKIINYVLKQWNILSDNENYENDVINELTHEIVLVNNYKPTKYCFGKHFWCENKYVLMWLWFKLFLGFWKVLSFIF